MKNEGRIAIELIKAHYEDGAGSFTRALEIRDWLASEHGIKAHPSTVRDWDRQARLERADGGHATTFPAAVNDYLRQASPTHDERVVSRAVRHKDTATRVRNDRREAEADAVQADASEWERRKPEVYKAVEQLLSTVAN